MPLNTLRVNAVILFELMDETMHMVPCIKIPGSLIRGFEQLGVGSRYGFFVVVGLVVFCVLVPEVEFCVEVDGACWVEF